jgi:hypothetical protein
MGFELFSFPHYSWSFGFQSPFSVSIRLSIPQLDLDSKGIYLPSMSFFLEVRPVLLREDIKTQSNESF